MFDLSKYADKIAHFLTAVMLACFIIFTVIPGGRYISIVLAILIMFLKTKGYAELEIEPYYIFAVSMILFTFFSSLWALYPDLTLEKAIEMAATFVYFVFLFQAYKNDKTSWNLMRCFKWAGYIVAIYLIKMYGINTLLNMLMDADRTAGEFGNSNTLGMSIAYGCAFEFIEICHKKRFTWSSPLLFPAILVISATQSRKAIIIIGLAFALSIIFYSFNKKNFLIILFSLFGAGIVIYIFIILMRSSALFSGMYHRMDMLMNSFTGEGEIGSSAMDRKRMIQIGWEQFLRTPIFGIGIGNAIQVIQGNFDYPYPYLHNNFVELLCCGGAVGFSIYYARYIYLAYRMIDYHQEMREDFIPCLIMVIITLIMDYGLVSYYAKDSQVFFVLFFLQVRKKSVLPATSQIKIHQCRYLIE